MHFYNSTNPLQREVVFGLDKAGIVDIAVNAAKLCRKLEETAPEHGDPLRVLAGELHADRARLRHRDLRGGDGRRSSPTTTARSSSTCRRPSSATRPNVYGDVIEWFGRTISRRRHGRPVSLHPHNDRGCAVAAAEFGVMAGADRVEGTLFGNGERTGNVDVVNLAMNLFANGVDPELDITDIDALRRIAEYCNRLPGPPAPPVRRRPRLHGVLRAATRTRSRRASTRSPDDYDQWGVPYLPIDPKHVGRTYEAVIRVNSQSGKGGVAYVMKAEHGFDLPRRMQIEFSKTIQHITEDSGTEISPLVMWEAFQAEYLPDEPRYVLRSHELHTERRGHGTTITAQVVVDGEPTTRSPARAAARSRRSCAGCARRSASSSTSSTTPSTRSAGAPKRPRRTSYVETRPTATARPAGASASTRTSRPPRCAPCSQRLRAPAPLTRSLSSGGRPPTGVPSGSNGCHRRRPDLQRQDIW